MKILRQYVRQELRAPFFYALLLLTCFLLFGQALTQILRLDIPLWAMGKIAVWGIPDALTYTVPMAFLVASLMGFGRLAGDYEILAMKSSGINFIWVALPVNGIALAISIFLLVLNFIGLPHARYRGRLAAVKVGALFPARVIPEGEFIEVFDGLRVYVERKEPQDNRLLGVRIEKRDDEGNKILIQAASAEVSGTIQKNDLRLLLRQGSVVEVKAADRTVLHKMDFDSYEQDLVLGDEILNPKLHYRQGEMTIPELASKLRNFDSDPEEMERGNKEQRRRQFQCEYQERWGKPFVILVLSLVGIPLAVGGKTGGKARSFGFSFIVFIVYYGLTILGTTLGEKGVVSPLMAAWGPNAIFSLVGIVLYAKVASE